MFAESLVIVISLKNSFSSSVIGSSVDVASPLLLQVAYSTNSYVGNLGSLSDNLIANSIPQRNSEIYLKLIAIDITK